jgi:hypothetical protein
MAKKTTVKGKAAVKKIAKAAAKVTQARAKLTKTLVKASKESEPTKPKEAPKLYREVPNSPIMLGRTYTECVHGVTGVATMYAVHLTGCNRVLLSRPKDKSSAYGHLDEVWTDETTILDENNEFVVKQDAATPPGHCGDHESANILGNPAR